MSTGSPPPQHDLPNFVADLVREERERGVLPGGVVTRFPPEPNGYLHVGHAKSIVLNFETALEYGGRCHLRFDDTNPAREDQEYVDAIKDDVRWLGYDWGEHEYYASDYFDRLYAWARELVAKGLAYVDRQSPEQVRESRGNYHVPGRASPDRDLPAEHHLELFEAMRRGELQEGEAVLRAKIDLASGNINLRDPLMYRIKHAHHHRTGDRWCIYPMYDWAHGQSDALEGITHSLCTLEFEDHRPLYEWFLEALELPHRPRQIEFGRLNLGFTVLSKRRLLQLVQERHVAGWDDPRMPTLRGLRRRGIPPEALRAFCKRIGVARRDGVVDVTLFEHAVREHLNATAPRAMAVLDPLKVVVENFPADGVEWLDAPWHPEDASHGSRKVPLTRELWVEREDYRDDPPKKWFRLAPGREVRLRYACLLRCHGVVRDAAGNPVELRCTWDPESRGGRSPDGRRVDGTLHWVSAAHAVDAEVRLYDRLFRVESPGDDFLAEMNPESLRVVRGAKLEPALAGAPAEHRVQFERVGYFVADRDGTSERPVWNRTISLRDTWARIERRGG